MPLRRLAVKRRMFTVCKQTVKRIRFRCILLTAMAQSHRRSSTNVICKRLGVVIGHEEKENQMIACYSLDTPPTQHVVYIGGDVQDYKENMELYNPVYSEWNLEDTAKLLQSRFKDSAVFVIKPSTMLLNTFSIFENFLQFDEDGRPEFSSDFGAILHLSKLYENAKDKAVSCDKDTVSKVDLPIKLVGFSKGCVVLNQIMFELETFKNHPEVKVFLNNLHTIYWLDGGHIGRKDAYITDDSVLKSIVDLHKELVVHVSAYQIKDINRPWIGREEKVFVEKLKEMKANIKEYQHFMNEEGSLNNHWKVLTKVP